jgi:hypothetical protein
MDYDISENESDLSKSATFLHSPMPKFIDSFHTVLAKQSPFSSTGRFVGPFARQATHCLPPPLGPYETLSTVALASSLNILVVHLSIANKNDTHIRARLAQSVERKALNLVVVGSSPTVGALLFYIISISSCQ